jgi:collagenase-like PrtC family protease
MKKDKILITINNLDDINKLNELGITKYVFPLKDFCVGMPNTFLISEIKDGYILINRILDNDGIDKLKDVLKNIDNSVKGIIFDDLGVLEIIKDLNIEKILYLTHFNTNSKSVNIYLDYVDTVILSTDITKNEIEFIINNSKKEISLVVFGYISTMYSRRLLLDNYSKFYDIDKTNPLKIDNTGHKFIVYENDYGTVFYYDKIFNGLELMSLNAKYYYINSVFLNIDDISNILDNKIDYLNTSNHFLDIETIYKLKEDE